MPTDIYTIDCKRFALIMLASILRKYGQCTLIDSLAFLGAQRHTAGLACVDDAADIAQLAGVRQRIQLLRGPEPAGGHRSMLGLLEQLRTCEQVQAKRAAARLVVRAAGDLDQRSPAELPAIARFGVAQVVPAPLPAIDAVGNRHLVNPAGGSAAVLPSLGLGDPRATEFAQQRLQRIIEVLDHPGEVGGLRADLGDEGRSPRRRADVEGRQHRNRNTGSPAGVGDGLQKLHLCQGHGFLQEKKPLMAGRMSNSYLPN